jgi:hypothetical protein
MIRIFTTAGLKTGGEFFFIKKEHNCTCCDPYVPRRCRPRTSQPCRSLSSPICRPTNTTVFFSGRRSNHFTQAGKQSICPQRSLLIASIRDDQKNHLRKYLFGGGWISMPACENQKLKLKRLEVLDPALASGATVTGILYARHPPPSMHSSWRPLDLPALESHRLRICEEGEERVREMKRGRRREREMERVVPTPPPLPPCIGSGYRPPDLAAVHRIWPPSTGFHRIEPA